MSKEELDNLVRIGKLKLEPPRRSEFDGMVHSARTHLNDALAAVVAKLEPPKEGLGTPQE